MLMEFFYTDRNIEQHPEFNYTAADLKYMLSQKHIIQSVCEEDNRIVAYMCAYDMGVWGLLDVLLVIKEYRNQMIGTKLVNDLINKNIHWQMLQTSYYEEDFDSKRFLDKLNFNIQQRLIWVGKLI